MIRMNELRNVSASIALAIMGCSSSEDLKCGEGTTLSNNACVPADIDSAAPQDTFSSATPECGPDAARPCEIDDAAETGDATEPVDGVGGDVADGGGTDAIDAATADMCPAAPIAINCSGACGGPTSNCAATNCRADIYAEPFVKVATFPAVVRTPDKPGKSLVCACGPGGSVWSMFFELNTSTRLRVTVGPGWRLPSITTSPFCGKVDDLRRCRIITSSTGFLVTTTDPNAPSRNVLIEPVSAGEVCP